MKIAITATPSEAELAPFLFRGDLAVAFQQASELKCHGVEIHLRHAADVDRRNVQRLMAEYGLAVPTLGTGMAAAQDGLTFSHPDERVRASAVERVCEHARLAAEIGSAVTIGLISGKLGDCRGERRRVARIRALECLTRVCRAAEALGVTIWLEPLNRYECDYINTIADGIAITAEIGGPNLKLLADTFHMNIEEADPVKSLTEAKGLVEHVHLADTNRQAPGHGHLNCEQILRALQASAYAGYLSLEILPIPTPRRALADAVGAIRAAMTRLTG
jgi:5-keto-L-gluconate epimerase